MTGERLIFVYNADEGWGAALLDAAHKLVSPATYACSLCAITYGAVSMKRQWRQWVTAQPRPPIFYHRQDFARAWPAYADHPLPAIFREADGALTLLMDDAAIRAAGDEAGLIAAMDQHLASTRPATP